MANVGSLKSNKIARFTSSLKWRKIGSAALSVLLFVIAYGLISFFNPEFEPLPTLNPNPPYWRSNFAGLKQRRVTADELASWQEYSRPDDGMVLRYPPDVRIRTSFRQAIGASGRLARKTADVVEFQSITATTDQLVLRFYDYPFSRENVTELGTWNGFVVRDPKMFELNGTTGYRMLFLDGSCDYEHYAFPIREGQGIARVTFRLCDGTLPFFSSRREAILKTLQFEKS